MSLFLHENTISRPTRPRVNALAVVALIVAVSGFLNVIGFLVGPVLAHVALLRLRAGRCRGQEARGRGLAIAALVIAYGAIVLGAVALLVMLVGAYIALPPPPPPHWAQFLSHL
ncbi:hypothetical protein ACFVU2_19560 [Leifsonia sp. NPDC058194]|uniref:hypothetical protein n=1 Tax=Leifsonia sp. NPDC058194 TaxID=3346374 RepID=UPI0036D82EE1